MNLKFLTFQPADEVVDLCLGGSGFDNGDHGEDSFAEIYSDPLSPLFRGVDARRADG